MKELPGLVFLSRSSVESRKRKLKRLFNVESQEVNFLFEKAREHGFIYFFYSLAS